MRGEYFLSAFFLSAFLFGMYTPSTIATTTPMVIINEINWNGNETSSNDEWLELYNPGNKDIILDNWTLNWNNTSINLTGTTITSTEFILLERTDDNTVSEITADIIYTGSLRNSGENIILKSSDDIVDQVDFSTGWPTSATSTTLERGCNKLSIWQYSENSLGTPKKINSICSADISNCTPIQTIFSCIADEIAEKSTIYNEDGCTDTLEKTNYELCACEYDNWIDEECSEGMRSQIRNNTNNLPYCTDITQSIADEICNITTEKTIHGRSCNQDTFWTCSDAEVTLHENYIDIPTATSLEFSITGHNNFDIIQIHNNIDITLYIFHITKKVIGIAQNWLFFGAL